MSAEIQKDKETSQTGGDQISMNLDLLAQPHYRFNILTREWILVSPDRVKRPWRGRIEKLPGQKQFSYCIPVLRKVGRPF